MEWKRLLKTEIREDDEMTFPHALVTRFFQLISNRHFAAATRELQRIKEKIDGTDWNQGYYHALQGMLVAQKANDNQYTFIHAINTSDKSELLKYKREFQEHVRGRFDEDFDRGFFSAWTDYTKLFIMAAERHKPRRVEGQTHIIEYAKTSST